jgi:hypothetical protein
LEEQRKKQELMKEYKKMSELDRKEKALDKSKESKANQLNFGANIVKF